MRPDIDRLEREDLAMFVNACFACSGQAEFYADSRGQDVAIQFLHEYILGNYRRLYARALAAGINHFNQSLIIANLLAQGAPKRESDREEEGALVSEALRRLPASRSWRLVASLRERGVNNRRTRAIVREFFELRRDVHHDAVKYRPRVKVAARHAHCPLPGELAPFLFENTRRRKQPFTTPIFEAHRRARTEPDALYELPYTVAEGFAARHRIPRDEFLQRIEARMTPAERMRLQSTARAEGASISLDLHRIDLTRLCLYALSLPIKERLARGSSPQRRARDVGRPRRAPRPDAPRTRRRRARPLALVGEAATRRPAVPSPWPSAWRTSSKRARASSARSGRRRSKIPSRSSPPGRPTSPRPSSTRSPPRPTSW